MKNVVAYFANIRIGQRITGGFGLVLIVLLGLAAFAVLGVRELNRSFDSFANMSRDTVLVSELESDITDLQLQVREYMTTSTAEDLQQARASYTKFAHLASEVQSEINDPSRVQLLRDIEVLEKSYIAGFEKIVTLVDKRNALVNDSLEPLGTEIRTRLTEINEAAYKEQDYQAANDAGMVQEDLLTARVYATRFLNTNDPHDAQRVRDEFKEIDSAFAKLDGNVKNPEQRAKITAIQNAFPRYKSTFDELVNVITERNALRKDTLDTAGQKIIEKAEAIKSSARADMDKLDATIQSEARAKETKDIAVALTALILGLVISVLIGRSITRPINHMVATMGNLAAGDTSITVPGQTRRDEIGAMAKAVNVFKDNMIETERLRAEQEDMKRRAEEDKRNSMMTLAAEFESAIGGIVQSLASAAEEMQAAAQSMSATAEQTSRQATAVAAASQQASANVETVAPAAEELTASVAEISLQMSNSTKSTSKAVDEAKRTDTTVVGLSNAAQKIGDVVALINEIASQTNLLALNATIEAARAGDAGKGFAVVATEVKALANQTARATDDIAQQISVIQTSTHDAVDAIKNISSIIGNIDTITTSTTSAVEEQGAATREIARNVAEAAKGTSEVSSNIDGVTRASGETGCGEPGARRGGRSRQASRDPAHAGRSLPDQGARGLTAAPPFIGAPAPAIGRAARR